MPYTARTSTPDTRRAGSTTWMRLEAIGYENVVLAVVLGTAGALLVQEPGNDGDLVAMVLVQAVTLPVLLTRRAPAWAAVAQAAGVLLNEVVVGPLVRCGVVLPVLFVITFQLGRSATRSARGVGLVGCTAVAVMELAWDPVLDASAAVLVFGLGAACYGAARVVRTRTDVIDELRSRTSELAEERDRTAAVAVAADRARLGADLQRAVRSQVHTVAETARDARRRHAAADDDGTRCALAELEQVARGTLTEMRQLVGTLRDAPTAPPPGLDQLRDLVAATPATGVRLRVEGEARPLTTNLELSAYRIVESLLADCDSQPDSRADVVVRFTPDALEVTVSTPSVRSAAASTLRRGALSSVAIRADVHGGSVRTSTSALGRQATDVRLPLVSGSLW